MPRRRLRGKGSAMTRRHCVPGAGPVVVSRGRHGARTALTRQPRRGGEGMVGARRHRCGHTTTGGRHDGASDSLPGGARCSSVVLHLPLPTSGDIGGGGGMTTAWGAVGSGLTPPAPSPPWERGSWADLPPGAPPFREGANGRRGDQDYPGGAGWLGRGSDAERVVEAGDGESWVPSLVKVPPDDIERQGLLRSRQRSSRGRLGVRFERSVPLH